MTGRFITLEGGEGVGKSTQARRLAEVLRKRGVQVLETREPGGSAGAEAIRALLLGGEQDRWTIEAEALLFAAARADHVARTIRPALAAGQWVLCDRYVDSSRAYQGVAGDLGDDVVTRLHAIGSGGLLPDRTLLLTMPLAEAAARENARDGAARDRIAARDTVFHTRVGEALATFARADPARFRTIDAMGDPPAVTDRLVAAIADLLPCG